MMNVKILASKLHGAVVHGETMADVAFDMNSGSRFTDLDFDEVGFADDLLADCDDMQATLLRAVAKEIATLRYAELEAEEEDARGPRNDPDREPDGFEDWRLEEGK